MNIVQRKVRGKHQYAQCAAPGCSRSARFDAVFLGSEFIHLCAKDAKEWADAYEHALSNWAHEAHDLAEQYRTDRAA